jgi:hypothetical protein
LPNVAGAYARIPSSTVSVSAGGDEIGRHRRGMRR